MTVKLLLVAWCSASLLAGGGLMIWFAVEMKILAHWLRDRLRARRHQAALPKARWVRRSLVPLTRGSRESHGPGTDA